MIQVRRNPVNANRYAKPHRAPGQRVAKVNERLKVRLGQHSYDYYSCIYVRKTFHIIATWSTYADNYSVSNYNSITATVIDPLFDFEPDEVNSVDVRATLRPILSPEGYHGFNLIDEMHCRRILLYSYITETDNNKLVSLILIQQ